MTAAALAQDEELSYEDGLASTAHGTAVTDLGTSNPPSLLLMEGFPFFTCFPELEVGPVN